MIKEVPFVRGTFSPPHVLPSMNREQHIKCAIVWAHMCRFGVTIAAGLPRRGFRTNHCAERDSHARQAQNGYRVVRSLLCPYPLPPCDATQRGVAAYRDSRQIAWLETMNSPAGERDGLRLTPPKSALTLWGARSLPGL